MNAAYARRRVGSELPSQRGVLRVALAGVLLTLAAFGTVACASEFTSCEGEAECGGSGSAGTAGEGSGGCDETQSPISEPCRLRDESAVFVTPDGDDLAAGTREAPLRTLAEAAARALESGKFVAACRGTYEEALALGGSGSVQLYGGFLCDENWGAPSAGVRSVVAPVEGVALSIERTTAAILVEGFEFRAADAVEPGASSIAALVSRSEDVTLRSVKLVAGRGADGANGTTEDYELPDASELAGKPAQGNFGGLRCAVSCPGGRTPNGGAGGRSLTTSPAATAGEAGTPALGAGDGGMAEASCEDGGSGGDGANAADAAAGAGAESPGVIRATGWTPSAGSPGTDGGPGQGGGGGRGGLMSGGGGGGCGGCGGRGGGAGQGGGGSIALLVYESLVGIEATELVTSAAGNGGAGGQGQPGQPGGAAGSASATGACDGGSGGGGASGGAGGGGAGGISVGILFLGTEPARAAGVRFDVGDAGAGGLGVSTAGNGTPGVRGFTLSL